LSAVKYKPEDLRPVAQLVMMTMVLVTHKDLPVCDVPELVALGITARNAVTSFPEWEPLAARKEFIGLEFDIWDSIQLARDTPIEIVKRLNLAVYRSLQNPDIRTAYEAAGNTLRTPMCTTLLPRWLAG